MKRITCNRPVRYRETYAHNERAKPVQRLCNNRHTFYEWNESLRFQLGIDGAGKSDETPAFRCSCGEPIDCDSDSCRRCGSTEPGEWR